MASLLILRNALIAFSRMLSSLSAAIMEGTVIAVCAIILCFKMISMFK